LLSPGEGHVFFLDGRLMWMKREVQVGPSIFEKIALSTFGRDKQSLEELVHAAMEHRIARELNRIAVYMPSPYNNEWMRARLGNNRKLDSVVLKAGQKESILEDLNRFFASHDRYEALGIPWRRGYLLYGHAGHRQTSSWRHRIGAGAQRLCAEPGFRPTVTDEKIGNLLSSVPQRSVIRSRMSTPFSDSATRRTRGSRFRTRASSTRSTAWRHTKAPSCSSRPTIRS
jgi:chaperone BCS1